MHFVGYLCRYCQQLQLRNKLRLGTWNIRSILYLGKVQLAYIARSTNMGCQVLWLQTKAPVCWRCRLCQITLALVTFDYGFFAIGQVWNKTMKIIIRLCSQVLASCFLESLAQNLVLINLHAGWRGTVVERRSLAGELSLSCARPAADGWPLMWISHPL